MACHQYAKALLALASFVITTTAGAEVRPSTGDCTDVPGTETIITGHKIVMVGEVHGTKEMPQMFTRLVCASLLRGNPVSVGLELPSSQQAPLDQYMASDGGTSARNALLASAFWVKGKDGRQSTANFEMIEALRVLRHAGWPLAVFCLEEQPIRSQQDALRRDEVMAARVRREHEARRDALVLTYTGNIHNMLRVPERLPNSASMGVALRDLHPISINLQGSGGTMWNCSPECGVHDAYIRPSSLSGAASVLIRGGKDGLYSGHIDVGHTTSSIPVGNAAPAD
jgi:hypothetical protein